MLSNFDTDLLTVVQNFLSPEGPLARTQVGYQARPAQIDMALAVARRLQQGGQLVVEAGTGVGKTFAYLLPILLAQRRVVISTASKTLQDQLYGRDLPVLAQALGRPVRRAVLKGMGNYLCHWKWQLHQPRLAASGAAAATLSAHIEAWSHCTTTGDWAELRDVAGLSDWMVHLSIQRGECLGTACAHHARCHVQAARQQAVYADVLVVNHHLFFAEPSTGDGWDWMPSADVVVFDEAHHLPSTYGRLQAISLTRGDWWTPLLQTVRRGFDGAQWQADRLQAAWQGLERLCLAAMSQGQGAHLAWSGEAPDGVDALDWRQAETVWTEALRDVSDSVAGTMESRVWTRWHGIVKPPLDTLEVRWIERGRDGLQFWRQHAVQSAMSEGALPQGAWQGLMAQSAARAWVFTSATLGDDDRLSWLVDQVGLQPAEVLRLPTSFDLQKQAAYNVPPGLPDPADPGHASALAHRIWPWILQLGGRTLVLTSSWKALQQLGACLQQLSEHDDGPAILLQQHGPKQALLDRFMRAGTGQARGAVLVGTATFWEGVDLPGDALQMLVIDKLPFPAPDEPWVQARTLQEQQRGRNPFRTVHLSEAAMALRQGVGRLIRRETDQGLLVIGDPRLHSRSYGAFFQRSLAPMRTLADEAELQQWVQALVTRTSTSDLPWL